jgi:hypothetical protein
MTLAAAACATTLGAILDFYTGDFLARAPSLIACVSRYRATPVPDDSRVAFIPHDWALNQQQPEPPEPFHTGPGAGFSGAEPNPGPDNPGGPP